MQYIILDGKQPTHKFKDGVGAKTRSEVENCDNVAVIVPPGFSVLDFDTETDAQIMLRIIKGKGLKTKVMKTTRGIHCWFKTPEGEKNFIKQRLGVGIYSDRKSGGRNAYVKIKQDGEWREWIQQCKSSEIQECPKWLYPVAAPHGKFQFKGMADGSGRNQELYNYIIYLQSKGYDRESIRECIEIINDYVFAEPLDESEIATIYRDDAFRSDEAIAEQIRDAEDRKFNHVKIAHEIIQNHHLIKYNGKIYEYMDNYYQPAEFLRKYVRETFLGAKRAQVSEVVDYISDMNGIKSGSIRPNPYVLNLMNTRLDIRTLNRLPFGSEHIEFDRLPVRYNPDAKCDALDRMIRRVFCDDQDVIDLFEEMIGYTLMKHSRYQKAFLFYGSGSNGKSTIMELIKTFLGSDNYTTIALEKVTDRFATAEIENKLANIGDDVDNVRLKDTGTLKKLFSGDDVTVERKGETQFTIRPYATHIYSCNAIPRSFDKSDGFYRRWVLIPFNAKFSITDDDYDPMISEKIMTDEALSHLLNIGIRGAKRLMERDRFTEPKSVIDLMEVYKTDNSNVLSWIEDEDLTIDTFLESPRDTLYSSFRDWCIVSGIKNTTGRKAFYKEITRKYDFDEKPMQRFADGKRYFVEKL